MPNLRRWIPTLLCSTLGLAACDPGDGEDSTFAHTPDTPYTTENEAFTVEFRPAESQDWPPTPGELGVTLEILPPDPDPEPDRGPYSVEVDPPFVPGLDVTAPITPLVTGEGTVWAVDDITLPEPGDWILPVRIYRGEHGDSFPLHMTVEPTED